MWLFCLSKLLKALDVAKVGVKLVNDASSCSFDAYIAMLTHSNAFMPHQKQQWLQAKLGNDST